MTTLVLGPEGTFSHELALRLGCRDIRVVPTISRIFSAVAAGEDIGIVPLENSEAGGVGVTLDGLIQYPVFIIADANMEIHHHLASLVPAHEIRVLYVHPQTHEQCSVIIEEIGAEVIHTSSNAASAIEMRAHPGSGAVVPSITASLYNIPIVREYIENNPNNITRFAIISRAPKPDKGCTICSILIDPDLDRAGLLYDLLGVFARRKINLSRIESRPSKRGMGRYVFFLDLACAPVWREALADLEEMTTVKRLGCYSSKKVPPWKP